MRCWRTSAPPRAPIACTCFQNVRDPRRPSVDGPGRRVGRAGGRRRSSTIPATTCTRTPPTSPGGSRSLLRGATCSPSVGATLPDLERAVLEARGRRVRRSPCRSSVRRGVVGLRGFDDCHATTRVDRGGDRRAPGGGRGDSAPSLERELADETQAVRGGSVPLDGRARTGRDLHRRAPTTTASTIFISPQVEAAARLLARGVDRRTRICGRGCCIPTIGPARSPRTSGTTRPASPSAWSTGCSTGTVTSCGCTTRRRWSATTAACPASRTA